MNNQNHTPLIIVIAVLTILVLGGIGYIAYQTLGIAQPKQAATTQQVSPSSVKDAPNTASPAATTSPALKTTGSTDADLNADLNDIDASLKAADSEQTSADQGLNDKQTDLSS